MPRVNFDRIAGPYRWLEYLSFGPWLARCRNAQLAQLQGSCHALVLGDGDGRFLDRLLAANLTLSADVVDSSQAMLRLLERRIVHPVHLGPRAHQRICLHHADALFWTPRASYDLIVTHFFLDCFFPHEVDQLLDRLLPHALPGAQWVVSEFSIPSHPLGAPLARCLIGLLYRAFAILTGLRVRCLPEYAAALLARGLILRQQRYYLGGLLCSQLWCLPANIDPRK